MKTEYAILAVFLSAGMLLSVYFKKLTMPAAITGGVCALLVFLGAGYTGVAIMTTFFIVGTLSTSWKLELKRSFKAAEENKGRRKASQVLANAGVAAIAGGLSIIYKPDDSAWATIIAAAFSAACADTLSSELGTVYGKKFINILTLKPDTRGLDGVISLEGTLIGVMGSCLIALVYAIGFGFSNNLILIMICGTIGNLTDSFLGAWLERRGLLKNDAVNFLNTLFAAFMATIWVFSL